MTPHFATKALPNSVEDEVEYEEVEEREEEEVEEGVEGEEEVKEGEGMMEGKEEVKWWRIGGGEGKERRSSRNEHR